MGIATNRFGRREILVAGAAAAGGWWARGIGLGGDDVRAALSYEDALRQLGLSLTDCQRELVVFASDDPTRQILNSQAVIERPHLGTLFSASQRLLIEQLYHSMLSPSGREQFAPTLAVEGRFDGCVLAIYGDPIESGAQAVFQGGHVMLRGGRGSSGAAFGGGVSYGHQTGNEQWKVPGNSFAHHGDSANRLFQSMASSERARAIVAEAPHELVVQVQGRDGRFDGVRLGELGEASQLEAQQLDTVFAAHPHEARAEALSFIAANGGLDELHYAVYGSQGFYQDMQAYGALPAADRVRRGDPYWQVWRIEGPGTIIHFKGYPHVHAYVQIVRDPARANFGTTLASAPTTLEGGAVGRLMQAALRRASGEELSFIGESIPGRICAGEVTTGLAYALDPYRNDVVIARIRGDAMSPGLRSQLEGSHGPIVASQSYRIATTDYRAGRPEEFGDVDDVETLGVALRDALVAELRAAGLRSALA